jgi:photosystem II stability/assembly factor-like uncharacterized protein
MGSRSQRSPGRAGAAFVMALALAALLLPAAAFAQAGAGYDTTFFNALDWTNVGPMRGGRSIAAAGSASRPNEYYFGATGGGLWKTVDGGQVWNPVTDGKIGSASVGAVGVCEANPDVVYIGTGERDLRGNIQPGDGVYKSTDAGKTWTHIGFEASRNIGKVAVDPGNCDRVFVAAMGHYGDPNPDRGIYRSTDGGQSWQKVLYRDDKTMGEDVVIDPTSPNTVYAALWEAWRKPWGMSSGGPGSGLFKSTDGGDHWTELTHNPGMPPKDQVIGKIGITVSPADHDRLYAIMEADSGGVFRSDDGGATWTRTNSEAKLRQRAFYYSHIYADPKNKDVVYAPNVGIFKSEDGGKTFKTALRPPHGDNHAMWIAPNDPQRLIETNDGGATVSVDGGKTWSPEDYRTAQFYRIAADSHKPYWLCGAQQDNSTVCMPGKDWNFLSGDRSPFFIDVGGGESGYIAPDPKDPNVYYAGSYGGDISRFDYATGELRAINPWPDNPMGYPSKDITERFQWTYPIVFSPVDPNVLYVASQHVFKSTDEGQSWERISPDLTRHDTTTMGSSGGPITKDESGVETYATIFAFAPTPQDENVLWSGSDDGYVNVTRDGGKTWTNVTPKGMPDFVKITTIEPSPHQLGKAYMVGNKILLGDFTPYIYKTTDYGQTWTSIATGIPSNEVARSIREDPVRPGLLYLGTEKGVWISFDDGAHWQPLSRNLPVAPVADLAVVGHDLAISTHGRAFWVMYNIGPLRQLTPEVAQSSVHLFKPDSTTQAVDRGVSVYYYLKQPADTVTLEFLDPQGQLIQSFKGTPKPDTTQRGGEEEEFFGPRQARNPADKVGLNRFVWDMRYPGFKSFEGMVMWAARSVGPEAVPGRYQVRLLANGETQTQPFDIVKDPRQKDVTLADLQARFDFAMKVRDRVTHANDAVLLIRGVNGQIKDRLTQTKNRSIIRKGQDVNGKLTAVEDSIYQTKSHANEDPLNFPIKLNNKLAALMTQVASGPTKPTSQDLQVYDMLSKQLDVQITQMNHVLDVDLAQLNQMLKKAGLPEVKREAQPEKAKATS